MTQIQDRIRDYVPQLIGAILTLLIGYIVALLVARVVTAVVRRTGLDQRLGRSLAREGRARPADVAPLAGRIAFWLIMLIVLLGFFQALNLTLITTPLDQFLVLVFAFLPRLLGAAILIAIAWVVATVLRTVLMSVLPAFRLDERLGQGAPSAGRPVTRSIAEAVYYLVLLLFLPAILSTLGLTGILGPVQHLVDVLLAFLPNLFAAVVTVLIGWFVARLVARLVTNLLAALGVDAFGARLGIDTALGGQRLSSLIGLIVYILILLPIVIAALQTLQLAALTNPASNMLNLILLEIPKLVAAALTLAIAYVVGRVLAPVVTSLLTAAGFDVVPARLGIARPVNAQPTPSALVGRLVLVALMLFATIEALQTIGFTEVAVLVTQFTQLGGRVILALIVFGIGLFLARLAAGAVRASGVSNAAALAAVAQGAILLLTGAMALQELGIGAEIITLAFALTLGAIAVASAIAFGWGGRDVAGRELERFVARRRTTDRPLGG